MLFISKSICNHPYSNKIYIPTNFLALSTASWMIPWYSMLFTLSLSAAFTFISLSLICCCSNSSYCYCSQSPVVGSTCFLKVVVLWSCRSCSCCILCFCCCTWCCCYCCCYLWHDNRSASHRINAFSLLLLCYLVLLFLWSQLFLSHI